LSATLAAEATVQRHLLLQLVSISVAVVVAVADDDVAALLPH